MTENNKRHDVRFSSNILYYSESIIDIDLGVVRFIKKNFSINIIKIIIG